MPDPSSHTRPSAVRFPKSHFPKDSLVHPTTSLHLQLLLPTDPDECFSPRGPMFPPLVPQRVQSLLGSLDHHPKAESLGSPLSQTASSCVPPGHRDTWGCPARSWLWMFLRKTIRSSPSEAESGNFWDLAPKAPRTVWLHTHNTIIIAKTVFTPSCGIFPFPAFISRASATSL